MRLKSWLAVGLCAASLSGALAGCRTSGDPEGSADSALSGPRDFVALTKIVESRGQAIVLDGPDGNKVLVSPAHQGRIFTMKVGSIESTGLVNVAQILEGETNPNFNNFGGLDRFWLGPEAGQFGLYFEPGVDFDRKIWKVPPAFDTGPFPVVSQSETRVVMQRDMEVLNYSGTKFSVRVEREVGLIPGDAIPAELGVNLPMGVSYVGAYSTNTITNSGSESWKEETGLVGIWILGQFNPSDDTVIIGPFRPGPVSELGPRFNDDYFGDLSEESPDRFKVLGNTVLFRADARREGKFGISQQRSTGFAGAIDFDQGLLTIAKFDLPSMPERYANSSWVKNQPEPYKGDALQSYNAGPEDKGSGELAPVPFYELESTSPVRALAPGDSIRHTHSTYHFQGDLVKLAPMARQILGVELGAVKEAMLR